MLGWYLLRQTTAVSDFSKISRELVLLVTILLRICVSTYSHQQLPTGEVKKKKTVAWLNFTELNDIGKGTRVVNAT